MTSRDDTVLVTGASGFLGGAVVRRLAESGRRVRALLRPGADREALRAVREASSSARVEELRLSLSDTKALAEGMRGVGSVLHVAAAKSGSAAAQVASTVVGSESLFTAALEARVPRVVLVSSLGVLAAADVPWGGVIDEATPIDAHPERRDPYTFAKLRQEQLAWKYHRERALPLVVVRPGVIVGPSRNLLNARVGLSVFGVFLHLGLGMKVPLTYVDNCADAVVRAGDVPGVTGRAYCIVDDDLPTSRELLRRYRRCIEAIPFLPIPFPALRALAHLNVWYSRRTEGHLPEIFTPYKVDSMWKPHTYPNVRARAELGWTMRVPSAEALQRSFVRSGA